MCDRQGALFSFGAFSGCESSMGDAFLAGRQERALVRIAEIVAPTRRVKNAQKDYYLTVFAILYKSTYYKTSLRFNTKRRAFQYKTVADSIQNGRRFVLKRNGSLFLCLVEAQENAGEDGAGDAVPCTRNGARKYCERLRCEEGVGQNRTESGVLHAHLDAQRARLGGAELKESAGGVTQEIA